MQEDVAKPTLKSFDWRVSAVKVLDVAEDAATYAEVECKRSAAFEGQYNALGQRHGDLVRAVYENNDCYLGTYADDLRAGKGMYIHANKAAFAGKHLLQELQVCAVPCPLNLLHVHGDERILLASKHLSFALASKLADGVDIPQNIAF